MASSKYELLYKVPFLITELGSFDGLKRRQARQVLVSIGYEAVPALVRALSSFNTQIRWEAAKALGEIADPSAAVALVKAMEDQDVGVRWVAMESLIAIGRDSVDPILWALTERFESPALREGAHHVFHVLKNEELLTPAEVTVFDKLEGTASDVEVPWAAEAALKEREG